MSSNDTAPKRPDYIKEFNSVIAQEKRYIERRRDKTKEEFDRIHKTPNPSLKTVRETYFNYQLLLEGKGRKDEPIGLAFSGGGIRSAIFNLGLSQGLSRFGILPWVDYLSTVSGGGYIGSCLVTLLSHEDKRINYVNPKASEIEKAEQPPNNIIQRFLPHTTTPKIEPPGEDEEERYYPFNTHWQRFPFNPGLQVFDVNDVAYDLTQEEFANKVELREYEKAADISLPLLNRDNNNPNRQLEHLRNLGNFLIPRIGALTLNTMRGLGAFLVRIVYTLIFIYLPLMILLAGLHYATATAFTPELVKNYELAKDSEGTTKPEIDLTNKDFEVIIHPPLQEEEQPAAPPAFRWNMVFTAYTKAIGEDPANADFPSSTYLNILLVGFFYSLLMSIFVSFAYRKDITSDNRLIGWESPHEKISLYSYLVIHGVRVVAGALTAILVGLSAWLLVVYWPSMPTFSRVALIILFAIFFCGMLYFSFGYSGNVKWTAQGLSEQDWIDKLIVLGVSGISLWGMTLWLAFLRWQTLAASTAPELQIYWVWGPAIFAFGCLLGLASIQVKILSPIFTKTVYKKENTEYNPDAEKESFRFLFLKIKAEKRKPQKSLSQKKPSVVSRGVKPFRHNVWSNPNFRSMFWTMQGVYLYALLAFVLLALLQVPNYFATGTGKLAIPLSTTAIAAIWAALIGTGKTAKVGEWLKTIFSLPPEIYTTVFTLLIGVLNLSVLFILESQIDKWINPEYPNLWLIPGLIGGAFLFLILIGWFVDANLLTAHYFYRDRLAEAFLQTTVDDIAGKQVRVVRDDTTRKVSRILRARCSAPYHIVQTSVNLAGSWHLDYKDTKSQAFIFTKLYSGSDITGYAKTETYRQDVTKLSQAIALSGAAVSSGVGAQTTFAQAFMTTLLNIRLGMWLTNPEKYKLSGTDDEKRKKKNYEGRVFWPSYLWDEARGRMSERKNLVNLTDGAHTGDNGALYPLFQRQCKFILASDAGEEPTGSCTSLFAVLRQVELDFGITVDINVEELAPQEYDREKKTAKPSKRHFVLGKITYPATFTASKKEETGWLVYFKPAIVEGDPSALFKYWERNKLDFPHPSTADQFFDEEQFEMMRQLGEWTVMDAISQIRSHFKSRLTELEKKENETWQENKKEKNKLNRYVAWIENFIEFDKIERDKPLVFKLPKKKISGRTFMGMLEEYHSATSAP